MMNTFQKSGCIIAVAVLLSAGCNNPSGNQTQGTDREIQTTNSPAKDGPWKEYLDSVMVANGSYKNGMKTGSWTYWYPNGQIRAEGHYRKGEKDGMWVQWYDDGEVMWKGVWDMGVRKIDPHGAEPEIEFLGSEPAGSVLNPDSSYLLQIRIPNVPIDFLFVEVSSGDLTRKGMSDQFVLQPSVESPLTLLIGYYPDKDFKAFRNLVAEIEFKIAD